MSTMAQQKTKGTYVLPKESLTEMEMVKRKLDWIDAEIKAGRRKLLTPKEALGEYAKYLKNQD